MWNEKCCSIEKFATAVVVAVYVLETFKIACKIHFFKNCYRRNVICTVGEHEHEKIV